MRVTISDIAKVANVTPSTVSRVIAGSHLISAETSQRVRRVMHDLDYHPNMIARSLVRRSTNIVAALLPGSSERVFQHPFFSELLRGITARSKAQGYELLLANIDNKDEERQTVDHFMGGGIAEGIILLVSRIGQTSLEAASQRDFPIVMVGRPTDTWVDRINWVDSDNEQAGYRLTKYFLGKGRRHIAFIGLAPEIVVTMDRFLGYRRALQEAGLEPDERLTISGGFMAGNEQRLTEELLSQSVPFDGVIAADDFQAFAAINLLTQRGLRVPEDVSVAGFNNVPLDDYFNPSLTSVDVSACALGGQAFDLLFKQLKKQNLNPVHSIVPTTLVSRVSV